MLKTILIVICLTTCWVSKAQQVALRILNGSFEEFEVNNPFFTNVLYWHDSNYNDTLYHWFGKGTTVSIQDGNCFDNDFYMNSPDTSIKPVSDNFYINLVSHVNHPVIGDYPNYTIGGFGQKTTCNFVKDIKYRISFYACYDSTRGYQIIENGICQLLQDEGKKPKLSVYLGNREVGLSFYNWFNNTSASYQIILNEYQVSYKTWQKIELEFTPDDNYEYIYFSSITSDITLQSASNNFLVVYGLVLLDAVSDIYYAEPTFSIPSIDTLDAGSCYTFAPYNIHPYTTLHRWMILGDSIFSTEATPTVCPTQTTTYVVFSNDNCGWAESDTITIFVNPKVEPPIIPEDYFNAYSNSAFENQHLNINSSQNGDLYLFDAAGRLIGRFKFPSGESTLPLQLAAGIYMFDAKLANGQNKNGKLIMIK